MLLKCILMTAVAFFSGSLMFSYFLPKVFKGVDVRKIDGGDGNPGSSNAIRAAGVPIGAVCMILDILKAFVPVLCAQTLVGLHEFYLIPVLIAPVLGHAYSPFLKFRGGKAISTAYGSLLAILPFCRIVVMMAIVMFVFKFIISVKPDSTSVFVSLCAAIVLAILFEPLGYIKIAFSLLSLVIISRVVSHPDKGEIMVGILGKWNFNIGKHPLGSHKI